MSEAKKPELFADHALMTMRVSHDSGQTWKPERAVFATDDLCPFITAEWPPCKCLRCSKPSRHSDL